MIFYRTWMKLLHYFDLHYAPESLLDSDNDGNGEYQKRCKWCGLSMSYLKKVE